MTAVGDARFRALSKRAVPIDSEELRRLSPMLILAPHQDDETLGCGGLIARASALGLKPLVAYLTDGGASHVGSPTWPAERLAARRNLEALSALRVLGVEPEDVVWLGWPDASPPPSGSQFYDETLQRLRRWTQDRGARSVWAPWSGEAHCDHLAAAVLAKALRDVLEPRPSLFSYFVWGWEEVGVDDAKCVRSLDCTSSVEIRRRALACHETQMTSLIDDAEFAFTISPELAALTGRTVEIFLELA